MNSRSGSLGSFECFLRKFSGDGNSTLAGPIVLIGSFTSFLSNITAGLNFDTYLKKKERKSNTLVEAITTKT